MTLVPAQFYILLKTLSHFDLLQVCLKYRRELIRLIPLVENKETKKYLQKIIWDLDEILEEK